MDARPGAAASGRLVLALGLSKIVPDEA